MCCSLLLGPQDRTQGKGDFFGQKEVLSAWHALFDPHDVAYALL